MNYQNITDDQQLGRYCRELARSDSIAFDTEFVSEDTYRPVLCLVQVAADGEPAVIDALAVDDMTPFWEVLAEPGHETIVHAGRSEMEFCLQSIGRLPDNVFDVQIAAGLAGLEYPIGYGKLLNRLLGQKPQKHETRTDWRRRPLSNRQVQYALDDARYLHPLRDALGKKLEELGRREWLDDEMATWQAEIRLAHSHQRWRRVSGSSGLSRHSLAIVRELWQWREDEARRRDKPVRRVLRDDLIVELAKRRTADEKQIRAVRGLERGDLRRRLGELAAAIRRALELPEDECPEAIRRDRSPQLSVLGQFLFSALGCICRQAELAPNLVGTPNDIRELVVSRTESDPSDGQSLPKLARGWRGEFVGRLFDDLLAGRMSIRVEDPTSEHPLVLEEYPGK
ncbi:MAG: HRDC domain-containing protein [Thermoguttaceae bacterium]